MIQLEKFVDTCAELYIHSAQYRPRQSTESQLSRYFKANYMGENDNYVYQIIHQCKVNVLHVYAPITSG